MNCFPVLRAHFGLLLMLVLLGQGCATAGSTVKPAGDDWSIVSLYPLHVGNAWSYMVDTGTENVLTTVAVLRADGQDMVIRSGVEELRYRGTTAGLIRVGSPGHVLLAPVEVGRSWPSGPYTTTTVARRVDRIETDAGTFTGCAEVVDEDSQSGKRVSTIYCPGVGPVSVVSELGLSHSTAQVKALLRGYQVKGQQSAATP